MGLVNRNHINNAHAYGTIQYMKTLNLELTFSQSTALHYLIRDIGITNFDKSILKRVLFDKSSNFSRIRGAWLALKCIDGIDVKTAISRRFEELELYGS